MTQEKMTRRATLAALGSTTLAFAAVPNAPTTNDSAIPGSHVDIVRGYVDKVTAKTATKKEAELALGMLAAMGWMIAFGKDSTSKDAAFKFTDALMSKYDETLSSYEISRQANNELSDLFQLMNQ